MNEPAKRDAMSAAAQALLDKIGDRSATIGVVALGYVGLPVALTFAEAGFDVIGVDIDHDRVQDVNHARSHIPEVDDSRIARLLGNGKRFKATEDIEELRVADAILIAVPTPLLDGAPDLSFIVAAGEDVAKVAPRGSLVVLESTTYPGTTEDVLCPLFERRGFNTSSDIFLAYSPERIDPANEIFTFSDIPKIVGGLTKEATEVAARLYEQVVPKVIRMRSSRDAEFTKLVENTFRHVNVALINELAVYAHEIDVDIWEVIDAAATKPFGYMPFRPGPGWGGHCIPLDPSFLSWRVRMERAHEVRFVELAQTINSEMTRYVIERATLLLNDVSKPLRGSRVLAIGAAYKTGTNDLRESPSLKVMEMLAGRGAVVEYCDPMVPEVTVRGQTRRSQPLTAQRLREQDLVIVLTAQQGIDWELVASHAPLIFDCCNALGAIAPHIERL